MNGPKLPVREQAIMGALRAQTPVAGLSGVRISDVNENPAEPFDVSFQLESGPSRISVLGEIKPHFTPKALEGIAPWIARLKAVQPGSAFAVIAPCLSPQAQEFCIGKGIDFIDLAGNISINVPGRFVLRRLGMKGKQSPEARQSPRIVNVYSGKASRVLRVLLQEPRQWHVTDIGNEISREMRTNPTLRTAVASDRMRALDISLGSVSKVLATLEQELRIRRRNSAIFVPEPRRLLTRWAEKYKERYRWRLRSSFTCPNPFGRELAAINQGLSSMAADSCVFTGAAAASLVAPFVELDMIDLFVASPEAAQRLCGLKGSSGAGPDLRFMQPYDLGVFMYARRDAGVPVVADVQAYLDLSARGGRDLKQAQYLLETRILPAWSLP